MKSNRKYILPFLALGLTMASCSDFLDKEPLDQGTDAIMFKSPEQFDQAALALYSFPDWKSANYDGGLDVSVSVATGAAQHPSHMVLGMAATVHSAISTFFLRKLPAIVIRMR